MIRVYLAVVSALLAVPSVSAQLVRIEERVEVESERMSLGDIAEIVPANAQLAGVPLGYSPYPGHYRWISKPDIEGYLHKWGLDRNVEIQMKDRVLVTRESEQIEAGLIEERVKIFLSSMHPEAKIKIHQIRIPEEVFVPKGEVELRVDPPKSVDRLHGLSLKLDLYSAGKLLKSQWVKVDAEAEAEAVYLKRDVPYGRILQPSDLGTEVRKFERLGSFFSSESDVVGSVSKRALREGEVVTRSDLKEATLVQRGDVVTLLARGSGFTVSALGKARDGGSKGDAVLVENLDSKQLVHATVIGHKTVEVLVAGGAR